MNPDLTSTASTSAYRKYLLGLLTIMLGFNYIDRFALGLVLQDIKLDLHLSDSQLGLVTGVAFALFYSIMGIPIAHWADRGNRSKIISLSVGLWSIAVALCGTAVSFVQLILIRVVVGVGEAGCVPPSLSLIGDYFSREERPRAVSVYMQGVAGSLFFGYLAAGWLNETLGWRWMFVAIGLPGLVLALLSVKTVKELRGTGPSLDAMSTASPSLHHSWRTLWGCRSFRHLLYSISVNWLFSYGMLQWTPTFFVRSYGVSTARLGTALALIYTVTYTVGTYLGGEWSARCASKNEDLQLKAMAVVTAISAGLMALAFIPATASNYKLALVWVGLSMFMGSIANGPPFAAMQAVVPPNMRAVSIAMVYLFGNLIGMGLGPWLTGVLSDALRPWVAEQSLRYAMLLLCPICVWSAWHYFSASQSVIRDIEKARDAP